MKQTHLLFSVFASQRLGEKELLVKEEDEAEGKDRLLRTRNYDDEKEVEFGLKETRGTRQEYDAKECQVRRELSLLKRKMQRKEMTPEETDGRGKGWSEGWMGWESELRWAYFSLLHSVKGCVSARFPLFPSQSCLHPNSFLIPSAFDPLLIHFSILLLLSQRESFLYPVAEERDYCCFKHDYPFVIPCLSSLFCLFHLILVLTPLPLPSFSLSSFPFLPSHSLKVAVVKTFAVSMSTSPATTHATKLMQSQKASQTSMSHKK